MTFNFQVINKDAQIVRLRSLIFLFEIDGD
jgi:hypothetical protein